MLEWRRNKRKEKLRKKLKVREKMEMTFLVEKYRKR